MSNKLSLQEKLIQLYQLEEAATVEYKEAIARLKEIRKERIELERLLTANEN